MARHLAAPILLLIALAVFLPAPAASQVRVDRVRVGQSIMSGLAISKPAAEYPALAKQARIQGTVVLRVVVSKSGDVEREEVISGHPMLAPAAVDAVKQWKYQPYLLNGEPVRVETQVDVNFALADADPHSTPIGVAGDTPGGSVVVNDNPQQIPQRIPQGIAAGLLVKRVQPQYPQDAKDQHVQGVVVLDVIIDAEGNVEHVDLVSGHPLLAPPAIEAVKDWKYRPYRSKSVPIEVRTQVKVNFALAE